MYGIASIAVHNIENGLLLHEIIIKYVAILYVSVCNCTHTALGIIVVH